MCKPDGEKGASSEEEVEREMSGRKKASRQTAARRKIFQEPDISEASQIKRPWLHQKKMSGIQTCQRQRLLRDRAVGGRASQAVSGCSYRLFFVFISYSPSRNFHHPACPALLVIESKATSAPSRAGITGKWRIFSG